MSRKRAESHCTREIGHQLLTDWTENTEIDTVIFAQCACELQTEQMFDLLLQKEKSALAPLVRGLMGIRERDLASNKLRKVWCALGGMDLTVTKWWSAWIECRKLRNTVAHAGAPVSTEQAEQAVKLATDYIIHITLTPGLTVAP
jgi:hypothetical protein